MFEPPSDINNTNIIATLPQAQVDQYSSSSPKNTSKFVIIPQSSLLPSGSKAAANYFKPSSNSDSKDLEEYYHPEEQVEKA